MQPKEPERSIKVFISYAHADQKLRQKLEEHLSPLKYSGEITIWQDQEIPPGENWENHISTRMNEAGIILLLISASFIASKYCWNKEVQVALERDKDGTARVIPIILKPVDWQSTPLRQLQVLPTEAKPVATWNDQDAAFENVAQGIRKVAEDLLRTLQKETQPEEAPKTVVSTSTNKEAIRPPSVPHAVDVDQKLTSALHSSLQDPSINVSSSSRHLTSTSPKGRRVALVLIPLILVLIGAGVWGFYTKSPERIPNGQATPSASNKSNPATATVPVNATATHPTQATTTTPTKTIATASASVNPLLGQVWHSRISGTTNELFGVVWSGSLFVVVGYDSIITSPNGVTWTYQSSSKEELNSVAWSGSLFVIVGRAGTLRTSPDGVTWTYRTFGPVLNSVVWSGSQFVAVGESGLIFTSPDGITWTPQTSGTTNQLFGVAWSGSQFVVVGDRSILTSPDGVTWTPQTSGTTNQLFGVAWSGSQFVAVEQIGAPLISTDGIVWTTQTSALPNQGIKGIAWSGSQFVVVGWNNTLFTSPDGINWTYRSSGTSNNFDGVGCSGSQCVVVGQSGQILTSP